MKRCDQCQMLRINGMVTHEQAVPSRGATTNASAKSATKTSHRKTNSSGIALDV